GLEYLSFDDLYNKLRTLEIDVKGGSSYVSRGTSAPTHSAFISAASTNSKIVLHSFIAESDPQQQITYEVFDQIGKLDLEELDIKWQMAMLSVRINRFEKKAGRKMKFNNRDAARFNNRDAARFDKKKFNNRDAARLVFKQIQTYLPQFSGLNLLMMILQPG
ncbi:hypothetical protein Tco_0258705, partial [Tanacetum coccineum]